uniref:Thioesterase domain-containing protein n=1 Tax=Alexandrium monilatum TaxID=311494 RepID=A0A7S4PSQ5_9DINO
MLDRVGLFWPCLFTALAVLAGGLVRFVQSFAKGPPSPRGYLSRVRARWFAGHVAEWLKCTGTFDGLLAGCLEFESLEPDGSVRAAFTPAGPLLSGSGAVHEGALALLTDTVTSIGQTAAGYLGGLSIEIGVTLITPVPVGERLIVRTRILKVHVGAVMSMEMELRRANTADGEGELLATGWHTKSIKAPYKAHLWHGFLVRCLPLYKRELQRGLALTKAAASDIKAVSQAPCLAGSWTLHGEDSEQFHYVFEHEPGSETFTGRLLDDTELREGRVQEGRVEWKIGDFHLSGTLDDGWQRLENVHAVKGTEVFGPLSCFREAKEESQDNMESLLALRWEEGIDGGEGVTVLLADIAPRLQNIYGISHGAATASLLATVSREHLGGLQRPGGVPVIKSFSVLYQEPVPGGPTVGLAVWHQPPGRVARPDDKDAVRLTAELYNDDRPHARANLTFSLPEPPRPPPQARLFGLGRMPGLQASFLRRRSQATEKRDSSLSDSEVDENEPASEQASGSAPEEFPNESQQKEAEDFDPALKALPDEGQQLEAEVDAKEPSSEQDLGPVLDEFPDKGQSKAEAPAELDGEEEEEEWLRCWREGRPPQTE